MIEEKRNGGRDEDVRTTTPHYTPPRAHLKGRHGNGGVLRTDSHCPGSKRIKANQPTIPCLPAMEDEQPKECAGCVKVALAGDH